MRFALTLCSSGLLALSLPFPPSNPIPAAPQQPLQPLEAVVAAAAVPADASAAASVSAASGHAWADFDGDGLEDVYLVNPAGPGRLMRNAGDGRFEDVSALAALNGCERSLQAAWIDFDRDQRLDLYLLSLDGNSRLLRGAAGGPFEDVTAAAGLLGHAQALRADWIDYDRDQRIDLRLSLASGDLSLYHNLGQASFEAIALELAKPKAQPPLAPSAIQTAEGEAAPAPDSPSRPDRVSVGGAVADTRRPLAPELAGAVAPMPGLGAAATLATLGQHAAISAICAASIKDQAGGPCILASRVPMLDHLLPLGPELFVSPSGVVGIGTTAPGFSAKVHVNNGQLAVSENHSTGQTGVFVDGNYNFTGRAAVGSTSEGVARGPLSFVTADGERMTIDVNGNVGIGTPAPDAPLTIEGLADNASFGGILRLRKTGATPFTGFGSLAFRVANQLGQIGDYETTQIADVLEAGANRHALTFWTRPDNTSFAERLRISGDGRVGIGVAGPETKLHLSGEVYVTGDIENPTSGTGLSLAYVASEQRSQIRSRDFSALTDKWLDLQGSKITLRGGSVGIGTDSPAAKLDVAGDIRTSGRVTAGCLTLTGGCDLAEPFDVHEGLVEPGLVVSIDPARPGALTLSTAAYDLKVAGVVSGAGGLNPGVSLSQQGVMEDGQLVALTGRVYCWCDASFGAIEAGDRLTTSATPGHAMKATDVERAPGSVIGKAMSALAQGKGLVLVLVNLQ